MCNSVLKCKLLSDHVRQTVPCVQDGHSHPIVLSQSHRDDDVKPLVSCGEYGFKHVTQ